MEKSKVMMIVIIALLVLLLGTIVFVSFYVTGLVRSQAQQAEQEGSVRSAQVVPQLSRTDIAAVSLGEAISTNLQSDTNGKAHYAVMAVSVGYDNSKDSESTDLATLLNADVAYMRSVALGCIYSKTHADLDNPDGIRALADEMLDQLQEAYETALIVEVNISECMIQ